MIQKLKHKKENIIMVHNPASIKFSTYKVLNVKLYEFVFHTLSIICIQYILIRINHF